jgi:hypothetical protein
MPDPTHEAACTAAVDLPDVRCASTHHPHRGAHHRTGVLEDGTRWTVFWHTPNTPLKDNQLDQEAAEHPVRLPDLTAEQAQLATPGSLPTHLRNRRRADLRNTLVTP